MSLIPYECVEFCDTRKICKVEENNKRYILENKSGTTIRKIKVDGCVGQGIGEKRCDYLVEAIDLNRVFFIELKGGDLNKAILQIHSTIIYLKSEFINFRLDARIVGRRDVPDLISTPGYRKLAKLIVPTKGTIERGTNENFTEKI